MLDERRDVGAEEVLALADADDQRRVAAGGDHPVGVLRVDGDQRERALEPRGRPAASPSVRSAPAVELALEQVRGDLGVGLGEQLVAGGLELGAQRGEVLDDPVVHQRDPAVRRRGAGGR